MNVFSNQLNKVGYIVSEWYVCVGIQFYFHQKTKETFGSRALAIVFCAIQQFAFEVIPAFRGSAVIPVGLQSFAGIYYQLQRCQVFLASALIHGVLDQIQGICFSVQPHQLGKPISHWKPGISISWPP